MVETNEAAIELVLLAAADAFAASVSLTIDKMNGRNLASGGAFVPPAAGTQWLRASVLPAPVVMETISFGGDNKYSGFLQIDVLDGIGKGTVPMVRTCGKIASYFYVGRYFVQDDLVVRVLPLGMRNVVSRGPLMEDSETWVKIPVSVPYLCFAKPA